MGSNRRFAATGSSGRTTAPFRKPRGTCRWTAPLDHEASTMQRLASLLVHALQLALHHQRENEEER
jgi:hypothetical protein